MIADPKKNTSTQMAWQPLLGISTSDTVFVILFLTGPSSLDETFKAAAYAWETFSDPEMGNSSETTAAPFNKVYDTKETFFSFYERPDQAYRRRRFGIAMQGVEKMQPPTVILNGE